MARQRAKRPAPSRLILDAGAVVALARRDQRVRAVLTAAWEVGAEVIVPAVVVAETVRGHGPKDAAVNRVLHAVGEVAAATEDRARMAGALLGSARSRATIDALVVAEALARGGAVVLTGDADDLGRLAAGDARIVVQALRG